MHVDLEYEIKQKFIIAIKISNNFKKSKYVEIETENDKSWKH